MNPANQKSPSYPKQGNNRPAARVASSQASSQVQVKKPSYLTEVRAEFLKSILEGYATSQAQAEEVTTRLWKFLAPKLAESYWNGVSAGASGRVAPKAQRLQPASRDGHNS